MSNFAILVLATTSITWLVTQTHGPYFWFTLARDRWEEHPVLMAITCPWCFAVWVSFGLHGVLYVADGFHWPIINALYPWAVAWLAGALCWVVATVNELVVRGDKMG